MFRLRSPIPLTGDLLKGDEAHPTPPADRCQGKMRNDISATFIAFPGSDSRPTLAGNPGAILPDEQPVSTPLSPITEAIPTRSDDKLTPLIRMCYTL